MPIIDFIVSHYVLMILLLLATIVNFVWLYLNRKDLKMGLIFSIFYSIFLTITGVISVVLFSFAENGFDINSLGNISLFGAIFLMPIIDFYYALIKKIPIGRLFDLMAISLAETLFFARMNCLFSGCCYGILIGDTRFRVPIREIELLFYFVFIIIFAVKVYNKKTNGFVYPIFLLTYGILRFITEFFRASSSNSSFHLAHVRSLISIALGILFLLVLWRLRYGHEKQKNIN